MLNNKCFGVAFSLKVMPNLDHLGLVGNPTLSARRSAQGLHFSNPTIQKLKSNVCLLFNFPENQKQERTANQQK